MACTAATEVGVELELPFESSNGGRKLRPPAIHPNPQLAHELAHAELTGLRAEKKMKKFRAPQTLAVLVSAEQLVRSVDTAARPTTHVPHDTLQSLVDAIAEVRPMVGSGQGEGAADDELDDEI